MLPAGGFSASLSNQEQTSQTAGPLGSATSPIFNKTVVVGNDNTTTPTTTATTTAGAGSGSGVGVPQWVWIAGGAVVALGVVVYFLRKR